MNVDALYSGMRPIIKLGSTVIWDQNILERLNKPVNQDEILPV